MDNPSTTRGLADIAQQWNEEMQALHCLRLQCVDVLTDDGVNVGAMLQGIDSRLTQLQYQLACIVSTHLSHERQAYAESPFRVLVGQR